MPMTPKQPKGTMDASPMLKDKQARDGEAKKKRKQRAKKKRFVALQGDMKGY